MRIFIYAVFLCLLLLGSGCAAEISVRKVDRLENLEYDRLQTLSRTGLDPLTENLLADYLLMDDLESDPDKVIRFLEDLYRKENNAKYLIALADVALRCGRNFHSRPDQAIRYYLSATIFSYSFLRFLDDPELHPYSADRVYMVKIYNTATAEVFDYLNTRKLDRKDGYTLDAANGMRINFIAPGYHLPLPMEAYSHFKLCCDYEVKNLTHSTRHFGLGVPLICDLSFQSSRKGAWAKDQVHPATLCIRFDLKKGSRIHQAQLVFCDTRKQEEITFASKKIPLALDFSTPIAYMAKKPLPLHHFFYMLYADKGGDMQGLYKFENYNENRIPVVLVHGLMSNTRTWIQMFNTLQNDPEIRKHYQFWGFSYSSGIPVLFTAGELRRALKKEREKLVKEGKNTKMFDQMVLIGHSMGGLLCKTTLVDSGPDFGKNIINADSSGENMKKLNAEQKEYLEKIFQIRHLDFVKRVIFIAVPHRGSDFARTFIGRLGSSLIRLPSEMISTFNGIVKSILPAKQVKNYPTGIDNLVPDNASLQELLKLPFVKNVPYHSIIGNNAKNGVPAGTDGIVPYSSSHLDGASSELVVKSGHSVQQNPIAIQEVRRILLEHLDRIKKDPAGERKKGK